MNIKKQGRYKSPHPLALISASGLGLLMLLVITIISIDLTVKIGSKSKLYDHIENTPHNKVGLLLGTAKYTSDGSGRTNLYYQYRIQAALELYKQGKINYILASGDNGKYSYNEPLEMQKDLIAGGIPKDKIYLDYAGFRTLDSIVRSQYIFGQNSITVISQPFHNERAIYIAKHKGINAIGYNAQAITGSYSYRVKIREKLARLKMMSDLILNKQPKFLGDSITIGEQE